MKKVSLLIAFFALLWCGWLPAAVITDEGAWCWFADPRALHYETPDGRTNMTYIGYIDTHGNIKAMQYDFRQRRQTEVLVRSYFQPDDHDNPTFLALPDGRIMIFYSRHTDEPCFYYRISQVAGDITTLGAEHVIKTEHNTTYPSPFLMADDPEHIYLCWRGINWHPTIAKLSLPDANDEVRFEWGPYQIVQSTGARPYAKYTSNGKDKISLTYTTGHPDNESPNFLYYNYIDVNDLTLRDIKGQEKARIAEGPFKVNKTADFVTENPDMVVDATAYRDWVWQIVMDKNNRPNIAMTRISTDKKSHNYYLARWDGQAWQKHMIAHGGGHFHQSADIEHCYSGGMALDTSNPSTVYCSVPVDGKFGRRYEIVKYTLDDGGEVVSTQPITSNSEKNNSRPYYIGGTQDAPIRLAWMNGDYYDWIVSKERPGYPTRMMCDFDGFTPEMYGPVGVDVLANPAASAQLSDVDTTFVYEGQTLSLKLNGAILSYTVDPVSLFPEIRYKGKRYPGSNRLATADSWLDNPRGTNGKWYDMVKLERPEVRFVYRDGLLRTFINGLVDQSVRLAKPAKTASVFSIEKPDYKRSPFTGMTRKHWIDAAEYLLSGAFGYIHSLDDQMYFPKQLDKTYPRDPGAIKVSKLEGLARTFFIAAPLLRENPGLTLNGIGVADYYRHQILNLITPGTPAYEPLRTGGPSQTLLELGSICMSLEIAKDVVWNHFSKEQKDKLVALFKSYGEGPTIGSNWRFFNVFVMSFLKGNGYEVNEEYLTMNIDELLKMYRGEGWYNDAPAYDYYSMWAFQTYGPLWAELFGKNQYPARAAQFIKNQRDMVDNYPYMFARDGRMNMYGRSIPYRFACVAPFGMVEFGDNADANYGWLRRISSASLLQFLQNPDFLEDGVPVMGFYGPFAPTVQIYSTRGSVYWLGKAFFNLLLPEDSKYWSAVENEGPWKDELKKGEVYNKFQPATNLMLTNYPNIEGSEIRSWCKESVARDWQRFRSTENYNKLAYHTEFPWMADGVNGEVSMNYATLNGRGQWEVLRLYDFQSFTDGVYRRDAVLETDPNVKYQLADVTLPDGVLRIDKVSVSVPTDVRLGSYSLPEQDKPLKENTVKGVKFLSNGKYQLAVVPLYGWDNTIVAYPRGLHPVSDRCGVIMNTAKVEQTQVFVTLQLWQKGNQAFSQKALSQVKSVQVSDDKTQVTVFFADGTAKTVAFK